MNLLKIKIQSQSDLITNSSSELFQLKTRDSVEQVNKILNQITEGFMYPVLFSYEEYEKTINEYSELQNAFTVDNYEEVNEKFDEFHKKYPNFNVYYVVKGWFFDENDPENVMEIYKYYLCNYNTFHRKQKLDKIQKEFREFVFKNKYILEEEKFYNNYTYPEVISNEGVIEFIKSHKLPPVTDLLKDYSFYYGNVKDLDGSILVLSKGENSIPYETWNEIREIFRGTVNYHLG